MEPSHTIQARGPMVLVTDDSRDRAYALTEQLRLKGFHVFKAYCGAAALAPGSLRNPKHSFSKLRCRACTATKSRGRSDRRYAEGGEAYLVTPFDVATHILHSRTAGSTTIWQNRSISRY